MCTSLASRSRSDRSHCAIHRISRGPTTDVLVIPTRVVPRLADLKHDELSELMISVQHVARVIERVYGADGLTIARKR